MGGILLRGRRETPADIIMVKMIEGKGPDQGHPSFSLPFSAPGSLFPQTVALCDRASLCTMVRGKPSAQRLYIRALQGF